MSRQQRRYSERKEKKYHGATYNLTRGQLDDAVRKSIGDEPERSYRDGFNDGVGQAMILMLSLPLEVMKDFYWQKSHRKKLPEFTEHLLEYYEKWQRGELETDKLKEDLLEYGQVRLRE